MKAGRHDAPKLHWITVHPWAYPMLEAVHIVGVALLRAAARLPTRRDWRWQLELAPRTRMAAWRVLPIPPGAGLAVPGYGPAGGQGQAVLRAEYPWLAAGACGQRSVPARAPAATAAFEPAQSRCMNAARKLPVWIAAD